jgi:hypothetical protein
VAVIAEGTLRLKSGESIGVRYRHRYEYRDWGLVACELELSCRFAPATARAVDTGNPQVYAALWFRNGRALVYLGNYSPKAAKGSFRLDPKLLGLARSSTPLAVDRTIGARRSKAARTKASGLRAQGIPYALKPWGTALFRIEG